MASLFATSAPGTRQPNDNEGEGFEPRSTKGRQRFSRTSRNVHNPRWQYESESALASVITHRSRPRGAPARESFLSHPFESDLHVGVDDCRVVPSGRVPGTR
jgi:hypothetical protein